MGLLVLVLRVALALVLPAAAVGKLLNIRGSRQAVKDFGLPAGFARVGGTLLPLIELTVAAALIPTQTGRWAGVGALLLMASFVVAIGRLMRAGQSPQCHCFGQLHSEPAGLRTLVRNTILAAAAIVVVSAGPGRSFGALSAEDVVLLAVAVVMLALAVINASLLLENRDLRKRPAGRRRPRAEPGLPIATPAPDLALQTLEGREIALHSLVGQGTPAVLIHISPQCGPCRSLAPSLHEWKTSVAEELRLVTVSSGELEENAAFAQEMGLDDLLVAEASAFGDSYRARATPSAVLIDAEGRVAARSVVGPTAIEALIRIALRGGPAAAALDSLRVVQVRQTA